MNWLAVVIFFSFGGFSLSLCFWGLIQRSQEKTKGRVVVGEVDEVVGLWQSNRELGGRLKRQEKLGGRRGLGVLVSWC